MARGERLQAQARLLASWGALCTLGIEERQILEALAKEDLGSTALTVLARHGARALAGGASLAGIIEDASELSFWVQVLLAAEPRKGDILTRAALLVVEDARGTVRRGRLWAKLRLLQAAGARVGDGFGSLAREARDAGLTALAEGLYSAAREGRQGADFRKALLCVGGLNALEGLCVGALNGDTSLETVLEALDALGVGEVGVPAETTLEGVVQAASETTAPLRRGLTGLLSKVENALGFDRTPSPRANLARETLEARASQRDEPAGADRVEQPEPEEPPARKTIAGDSGPVNVGSLPDTALEAWALAFSDARAKQSVLDVQPAETAMARELQVELQALRTDLTGELDTPRRRDQLEDLEERFSAWQAAHAD